MIVLGLLLGLVGTDLYTGTPRFTLGYYELADGLEFTAIAVGIFGIAEILRNLEDESGRSVPRERVTNLLPNRQELGITFSEPQLIDEVGAVEAAARSAH